MLYALHFRKLNSYDQIVRYSDINYLVETVLPKIDMRLNKNLS